MTTAGGGPVERGFLQEEKEKESDGRWETFDVTAQLCMHTTESLQGEAADINQIKQLAAKSGLKWFIKYSFIDNVL